MRLHKRLTGVLTAGALLAWAPIALAGPVPTPEVFAADFNGDGNDDLALVGGGDVELRHLSGVTVISTGTVPTGGGTFDLKAVGYLDAGPNADTVYQGAGQVRISFTTGDGTGQTGTPLFFGDGGGSWGVVAACDVNGDGIDEVISIGSGAALGAARITDVSTGTPTHTFLSTAGGLWGFGFCADVNGDGDQDIYFVGTGSATGTSRANLSGGATALFYAQGGGVWDPSGAAKTAGTDSDSLIDTGNGAASGFLRIRTLDSNGAVVGTGFVPNGGGTQVFVFGGDFNDDGREDLALRAGASHKLILMAADGVSEQSSTFPGAIGGNAVLDQGADTNGDGVVDLVSVVTGSNDVFVQDIENGLVTDSAILQSNGRNLFNILGLL